MKTLTKKQTADFLNENDLDDLKLKRSDDRLDWVWSHPTYAKILSERSVREKGDRWYEHPKLAHLHLRKFPHLSASHSTFSYFLLV